LAIKKNGYNDQLSWLKLKPGKIDSAQDSGQDN